MSEIKTTTVLTLAECGYNEFWLRDIIYEDPSYFGTWRSASSYERDYSTAGRDDWTSF